MRITAKADDRGGRAALLDAEEAELRALLGDLVFGVDDETMEARSADLLARPGPHAGRGRVADRRPGRRRGSSTSPGASEWFRGSIVAYDSEVKFDLLGVPEGPVVCAEAAEAMAEGARRCSAPTSAWRSPASPARPSRTASPSAPSSSAWPSTDGAEAVEVHLPGDREPSASSPPSRCSTSCAAACSKAPDVVQ